MRLRFRDKPCGTILGDVFPRATALDLSQLNLRNKAFWNPPAPVTRQPTTDATGKVTTLRQLNARNENFWRGKS
jgi:hypothetical protein